MYYKTKEWLHLPSIIYIYIYIYNVSHSLTAHVLLSIQISLICRFTFSSDVSAWFVGWCIWPFRVEMMLYDIWYMICYLVFLYMICYMMLYGVLYDISQSANWSFDHGSRVTLEKSSAVINCACVVTKWWHRFFVMWEILSLSHDTLFIAVYQAVQGCYLVNCQKLIHSQYHGCWWPGDTGFVSCGRF